jgi:hypothetical protein
MQTTRQCIDGTSQHRHNARCNTSIDLNWEWAKRRMTQLSSGKKIILVGGLGLIGWSLLPDALWPLKIYCASPTITSQLVLFLWQTVEIDPFESCWCSPKLCPKMQPHDIVRYSHSHSRCSTGFYVNDHIGQ